LPFSDIKRIQYRGSSKTGCKIREISFKKYSCFEDMGMGILTPQENKSIFNCNATSLLGSRRPHDWGFEVILRNTTLGRTPLGG